MADSVPPATTLLQAAARYLEDELLPTLEGYHRFQTRVTLNVLRIVERELRLEGERGGNGNGNGDRDPHGGRLALAEAIRCGELPIDTPGLAAQLRAGLAAALAVNNPKWTKPGEPP
jgi:hypothetical protein